MVDGNHHWTVLSMDLGHPKRNCFLSSRWPVGRTQNLFFFNIYIYFHCIEIMWKMQEMRKECTNSPLISSAGRWTGKKKNF